jgi:hypothetical protein
MVFNAHIFVSIVTLVLLTMATFSLALEKHVSAAGITQLRPPSSFTNAQPNQTITAKPNLNHTFTIPKEVGSASPNILGRAGNTTTGLTMLKPKVNRTQPL